MKRPWILRTACLQVRRPLYHVHLMTALIVSELSTWFLHSNFCGKRSSSKNPYPSDFMVASLEWPSHFPAPPCGFMSHLFLSTVKVTSIFYSLNLPSCLPITSSVSQKFLDAHPGLCVSLTCTPPPEYLHFLPPVPARAGEPAVRIQVLFSPWVPWPTPS